MSVMIAGTILLLCVVGNTLSLPLSADGIHSWDVLYCKPAGCAANVSKVFCDDKPVFENGLVPVCGGLPPPLHTVCQHDGRAFVSAPEAITCEFEEQSKNIDTTRCTDNDPICSSIATTSSPAPPNGEPNLKSSTHIILLVVIVISCGL